jgi:hypothetical protein
MNLLRSFVQNLSDDELISILKSYDKFETDGFIGDEPIRTYAKKFLEDKQIDDSHIVTWMTMLAMECYRVFANRYIIEHNF